MIKIITDSSADLKESFIKENNIEVIKIPIYYNEKDISNLPYNEFLDLLEKKDNKISTSQINPNTYIDIFKKYKNDMVLYIGLGSGFSGTFSSATMAKQMLSEEINVDNIYLFDSGSASLAQGYLVEKANELKDKDISIVIEELNKIKNKMHFITIIDDLSYLHASGRLSKTSAFLGNSLNIKPIISVLNNKIEIIKKIRGTKNANEFLKNFLIEKDGINLRIGCIKNNNNYLKLKENLLNYVEFEINKIISCHAGPSCYGIFFIEK